MINPITLFVIMIAFIITNIIAFVLGQISLKKKIKPQLVKFSDVNSELSGSSAQIEAVNKDINQSSLEQIDVLSSTVSASHQIRSMVEKTNENAKLLKDDASNLLSMTHSGNDVIEEMVITSQEIESSMNHFRDELNDNMKELDRVLTVIKEIASKTEIINSIVFQTKLLSFNASVEAARAGESGKGFSVVAEEIGQLAAMSGTAAREISQIVEKSIEQVTSVVKTTRHKIETLTAQTIEQSATGLSRAQSCKDIFSQMSEKIQSTSDMVAQISTAAAEQSEGVSQLDQSIQKFQEAADRNRLIASQATEHAHSFSLLHQELDEVMDQFKELTHFNETKKLPIFYWNDQLSLDVPNMDAEHKVLIEKINILIQELEKNKSIPNSSTLIRAFTDLTEYTAHHFSDEESYMESIGYPQLNSHRKIHQNLLKQVGSFTNSIQSGQVDDAKLVSFLRNWIISHIMGVDMQYSEHAHQKPQSKKTA